MGSAGNQILRVVGAHGSRYCPMYMCWNALASVFNFFAGQNLAQFTLHPMRELLNPTGKEQKCLPPLFLSHFFQMHIAYLHKIGTMTSDMSATEIVFIRDGLFAGMTVSLTVNDSFAMFPPPPSKCTSPPCAPPLLIVLPANELPPHSVEQRGPLIVD